MIHKHSLLPNSGFKEFFLNNVLTLTMLPFYIGPKDMTDPVKKIEKKKYSIWKFQKSLVTPQLPMKKSELHATMEP